MTRSEALAKADACLDLGAYHTALSWYRVAANLRRSAESLAAFIRSHDHPAYVVDGRIIAVEDYGWGFAQVVTIEPTLRAVRDWLGY